MSTEKKAETARDEYEAMRAARKLSAESSNWLDRVLSSMDTPEEAHTDAMKRDSSR